MIVSDQTSSSQLEDKPPEPANGHSVDSSGFGLVNWLFDHIKDRRPIFLSLFRQYDKEAKIFSDHKILGGFVLAFCLFWDGIMFLIYMAAVALIVAGITFIFVKGTGLLDYIHPEPTQQSSSQQLQIQTRSVTIQINK